MGASTGRPCGYLPVKYLWNVLKNCSIEILIRQGLPVYTLELYHWVWQSSGPSRSDDVNFDPYPRHLHLIRPDDTSISGLTGSSHSSI